MKGKHKGGSGLQRMTVETSFRLHSLKRLTFLIQFINLASGAEERPKAAHSTSRGSLGVVGAGAADFMVVII